MDIVTAKRLYDYRKANNLSQEELAEKIGVSRQAISKWERAESSPDTDNLIALAKLYNVSIDEMLNGEGEPEKLTGAAEGADGDSSLSEGSATENATAPVSAENLGAENGGAPAPDGGGNGGNDGNNNSNNNNGDDNGNGEKRQNGKLQAFINKNKGTIILVAILLIVIIAIAAIAEELIDEMFDDDDHRERTTVSTTVDSDDDAPQTTIATSATSTSGYGSGEVDADGVTEISVDWSKGNVTVESYDGETIKFEETKDDDTDALYYVVKEGELKIEFTSSKVQSGEKDLVVYVPESTEFNDIGVEGTEADVKFEQVTAYELDAEVTSGNIKISACDVDVLGLESTTGDITAECETAFARAEIETTTGDVEIFVPQSISGFTVEAEKLTGSVTSNDFELTKSGGNYYYGDGSSYIEFSSATGSLAVNAN